MPGLSERFISQQFRLTKYGKVCQNKSMFSTIEMNVGKPYVDILGKLEQSKCIYLVYMAVYRKVTMYVK